MRTFASLLATCSLLTACSGAPSSAAPSTAPTATVTATAPAAAEPTPTAQPSPKSLIYPVAEGEEWILFDAPADDPGEPEPHDALFLVRPDGSGLHRLVRQMTGSEVRATWSPDGSQVAYIQTRWPSESWADAGLYVVNADGSDPHRVYECSAWCNTIEYPDWGSDGAIYVSIDSNVPDPNRPPLTFAIWRIDPVSGEARAVLTREDEITAEQPRVSPDGTQLVYIRERIADGRWAIFVADMAGGKERRLTDWAIYASYPDWSIDGRISFNTYDLRLHNRQPHWIYTMKPDGSNQRLLQTRDPDDPNIEVEAAHARWTDDGSEMTFTLLLEGHEYIGLMNADGSDQRLVPGPVRGTFSELRPIER